MSLGGTRNLARLVAAGATLVVGLAVALDPVLGLALFVGLGLLAVVLTNITAGVMVFVAVSYLQVATEGAAGAPSMAKFVGMFLVLGWLGSMMLDRSEERASRDLLAGNPMLVLLLGLFLCWSLFSLLWAEDPAVAQEITIRFALLFVLFPIVVAAIRTERAVVCLYTVMITCALIAAAMAWGAQVQGNSGRLGGDGFNSNELGLYLIASTVLAASLAFNRRLSSPGRFLALVAAVLSPMALVLTGSRGAFIGLVAALAVTPLAARRGRRLATLAVVGVLGLAAFAVLGALASTPSVKRVTSLGAEGGSGRVDLWRIGLRIVDDKPMTGVGAGNFEVSSVHYLLVPGSIVWDEYIVDKPQVPHNIYLQVLTEYGIVGLTLFLSIIGSCLVCALRAAKLFRSRGSPGLEIMSRGLFLALVGMLAAEFFSSQLYNKQLYILLATAPALLAIARQRSEHTQPQ
jgi:O-antigen ligase